MATSVDTFDCPKCERHITRTGDTAPNFSAIQAPTQVQGGEAVLSFPAVYVLSCPYCHVALGSYYVPATPA